MKRCIIIGAGPIEKFNFTVNDSDYIIAADGGLKQCKKLNLKPNLIVGDFDSLGYVPDCDNKIVLPTEKDITDMDKTLNIGTEMGYNEFHIFGGMGGRVDHSIANISLIANYSQRNIDCFLYTCNQKITAITDKEISYSKENKGIISVFSFTDTSIVSETGLKYPLNNYLMKNTFAIGVSNEFINKESIISVKNGTLIIVEENT